LREILFGTGYGNRGSDQWFDEDDDSNGDLLNGTSCTVQGQGMFDCVNTANLNDTVVPAGGGNLQFCVVNNTTTTVVVQLDIVGSINTQN
jgi:hypothetical protein